MGIKTYANIFEHDKYKITYHKIRAITVFHAFSYYTKMHTTIPPEKERKRGSSSTFAFFSHRMNGTKRLLLSAIYFNNPKQYPLCRITQSTHLALYIGTVVTYQ